MTYTPPPLLLLTVFLAIQPSYILNVPPVSTFTPQPVFGLS